MIANVRVGRPDVRPTDSGHVAGVYQGNAHHLLQRPKGIDERGRTGSGSARRSTGIRPAQHEAIDPRMPKISPA